MTRLYLLRHGPTRASGQGAPLGRLDLPVTAQGQALWPQVRAELIALGLEQVLCSPLVRARSHAQDLGLPCQVVAGLSEQAFGDWDGRPWAELTGTERFFADPVGCAPPGGESFGHCAERSVQALTGTLEQDRTTLILAHAGPLRALLAHFLGLDWTRALDLAWQPFGLTRLDCYQVDRAVLAFHNRSLPSAGSPGML